MKIEPMILGKHDQFQSPFHKQFALRRANEALDLPGRISKNYSFPTLYGDVTTSIAMFFCSHEQAKLLMPSPLLKPVDMGWGRSVVIFSSYRYNKVHEMTPYDEIAISIPVVVGNTNIPVLPLLLRNFKGLGHHVISMPVTTLENRIRGHVFWGLPKVVQEINLNAEGGDYVATAKDENGITYLKFRVPVTGSLIHVKQKTPIYSSLKNEIVRSFSFLGGDFVRTKWLKAFALKGHKPQTPYIELGNSPSADFLKALAIEPHPFEVRFGKGVESAFHLPENLSGM